MKSSHVTLATFCLVLGLCSIPAWSWQKTEAETKPEDRQRIQRLEAMRKAAEKYRVVLDNPAKDVLKLRAEPALRWTNPVRGTTDGVVLLWLVKGRPEMAAGIYKWGDGMNEP